MLDRVKLIVKFFHLHSYFSKASLLIHQSAHMLYCVPIMLDWLVISNLMVDSKSTHIDVVNPIFKQL